MIIAWSCKHVTCENISDFNGLIMSDMFYEKALINNITLSRSLNTCKCGDSSAKRGLYLSKGGTI